MNSHPITRRGLITGKLGAEGGDGLPESFHVSSAVILARPAVVDDLLPRIAALAGVEIVTHENGRIVVVIEGRSSGELGERLTTINLLDGVLAANMVFEHTEQQEAAP